MTCQIENILKKTDIKIIQFNLENFFVFLDQPEKLNFSNLTEFEWQRASVSLKENKSLTHLKKIAQFVLKENADIYIFCEVGGRESIEYFCKYFLEQKYQAQIIEGNSDRGIDLAYIVKSDSLFKYDLRTHKNRPIDFLYPHEEKNPQIVSSLKSHKFSRDVLELRVFSKEEQCQMPCFVVLNVHLKSQLDKDGIDPLGKKRRAAEFKKLLEIYREISLEFDNNVPVIIGGDFNGRVSALRTDPEFLEIHEMKNNEPDLALTDILEYSEVPEEKRTTHVQFSPQGRISYRQFDYIFVSNHLKKFIHKNQAYVYRFEDEFGMQLPLPQSLQERKTLPSDHLPVVLRLSIASSD